MLIIRNLRKDPRLKQIKVEIHTKKLYHNRTDAFWYHEKGIATLTLGDRQVYLETAGEIKICFPGKDGNYSHHYRGHKAVRAAKGRRFNDKDLANNNKVAWNMNNWFHALVRLSPDDEWEYQRDYIEHDYDSAIDMCKMYLVNDQFWEEFKKERESCPQ